MKQLIDINVLVDVLIRLQLTRLPHVEKILDLGSCDCTLMSTYPYLDTHITFTDLKDSDGNIFQKTREQNKHNDRFSFIETSCDDLSMFEENSFDMVTFSNVIEHLTTEQIDKTMIAIKRVLKPNGLLVAITPNKVGRKLLGKYLMHPGHIEEFTAEEMLSFMYKYKFKIGRAHV